MLKAKTEQFLYCLLWTADQLSRPTFRNLSESFEGWAYRSGLSRRIAELERREFLERRDRNSRLYRLTAKGRCRALGGRDPQSLWARPWDGWWRLICFDVPLAQNRQRMKLRYYLHSRWFGLLQRSIWISPDPINETARQIRAAKADVNSLVLLQARTCGGESNAHVVASAWDFRQINSKYARYLKVLDERPRHRVKDEVQAKVFLRWAQAENGAWSAAMKRDPLLPKVLLPKDYLGREAWLRRVEAWNSTRRHIDDRLFAHMMK